MKYIIATAILIGLFILYVVFYIMNSKTDKPEGCLEVDCNICKLNCNKRREI